MADLCYVCGTENGYAVPHNRFYTEDYHPFVSTLRKIKEMNDTTKLSQYRQGDVLLIPVASLPENLKPVPRDNDDIILAYGEVTGHAHRISAPSEEAMLLTDKENQRFLNLVKPANLTHEEHAPINLPAGTYIQVPQEEWQDDMERPEENTGRARRVID